MLETWTQASGGALHEEPLLLRVNRAGAFGSAETYPGGSVRQALFTYLCGAPNPALFAARPELFFGKWLVCMSAEWAAFVREKPLETTMRRIMMQPRLGASLKALKPLPSGYRISGFTPEIFAAHPFGQGQNYPDFADFACLGAGAAVLCGDKVVAAASSFLMHENDVELDVATDPDHRRKGLADHCVARMLNDCTARGLTVHWDAQNTASANIATAHGFVEAQEYAVYVLKEG